MLIDVSRQVLPIMQRMLVEKSALGGIALANRGSKTATSTKLEWKEMTMGRIKKNLTTALSSGYLDDTNKTIELNTTNLLVGDIFSVQDLNKKSKGDYRFMITEIVSGTQAKAQKIGGTDIAILVTDILFLESTSEKEGSTVTKRREIQTPVTLYNRTQIIRAGHAISRTMAQTNNWDFNDIKKELRTQAYKNYAENLDGIVTSEFRTSVVLPDGSERRVAGGLPFYANNLFNQNTGEVTGSSDENTLVVNGDITMEHINFGFKHVIDNGGELNSLVANTAQIMQIAKFEADKINVNLLTGTNATTLGGAVQVLKSPIKMGKNEISSIYVDMKMPQDEVMLFNTTTIEAIPLQGSEALEEIHEPTAKDDNYSIDLLGEWTLKVNYAKNNTFVLKKLTVPTI